MRPPLRSALLDLRVKDLQHYLNQHNVSTRGCLGWNLKLPCWLPLCLAQTAAQSHYFFCLPISEKEDLVNVLLRYANTPANASSDTSGNVPPNQGNFHYTFVGNNGPQNPQVPSASNLHHPHNSSQPGATSSHSQSEPSSSSSANYVLTSSSDQRRQTQTTAHEGQSTVTEQGILLIFYMNERFVCRKLDF